MKRLFLLALLLAALISGCKKEAPLAAELNEDAKPVSGAPGAGATPPAPQRGAPTN